MRYWWVNQNQTYRHEVQGGYLWSPKRNANGARNPFYESMREVAPGDLVFSFIDTRIAAIGVAQSYCWENPKPAEFGAAGQNWENIGWKVSVKFTELENKIRPKDHIGVLRPLLPERYSPLQPNGNGLQSVYLTGQMLVSHFAGAPVSSIPSLSTKGLPIGLPEQNNTAMPNTTASSMKKPMIHPTAASNHDLFEGASPRVWDRNVRQTFVCRYWLISQHNFANCHH